jgi:Ribbon-helix-helix protein, copG family
MLEVKLEADLAEAVARQARREKKSKASVVRSALMKYLEDAGDYRDAMAVLKKKNPSVPLEDIEARIGMAGSPRQRRGKAA